MFDYPRRVPLFLYFHYLYFSSYSGSSSVLHQPATGDVMRGGGKCCSFRAWVASAMSVARQVWFVYTGSRFSRTVLPSPSGFSPTTVQSNYFPLKVASNARRAACHTKACDVPGDMCGRAVLGVCWSVCVCLFLIWGLRWLNKAISTVWPAVRHFISIYRSN